MAEILSLKNSKSDWNLSRSKKEYKFVSNFEKVWKHLHFSLNYQTIG